jgi:hypothetical protein
VGFASGRVSSISHSSSYQMISGYNNGNRKSIGGWPFLFGLRQDTAAMSLCKQRSQTQVCQDNFDTKAKKSYHGDQYSAAFKQAAVQLSDLSSNDETRGRWVCGAPAIAAEFNESMLSSQK